MEANIPAATRTLEMPLGGSLRAVLGAVRRRGVIGRKAPARLVIIGNGMVGHRLCERLVEQGATAHYRVTVLGEESTPAYDRVHLTDVLRGRPKGELIFRNAAWYLEREIELRLGDRAERIDRSARCVVTESGARLPYDSLVLATGSRAVVPTFATGDADLLMSYRTLEDAERILGRLEWSRSRGAPVMVVGGGLLGLEAARVFQELGCHVVVVEAASQLLPRQLDPGAASELERVLSGVGLDIRLRTRIENVVRVEGGIRVRFDGGAFLDVGAVVAAVGARARDELGAAAGLRCAPRGGIEVDADLRTSDPHIHAIGECASHVGVPHGLVAPGYAMADALSLSLNGTRRRLGAQQAVTRLKLDVTEVTVLGSPADCEHDREVVFQAPGAYRRLFVLRGRVVAAVCVGPWSELAPLQGAVAERRRYSERVFDQFERDGTLGQTRVSLPVASWPDAAVVCQCANVTRGALRRAAEGGATTAAALSSATSAGSLCGSCQPLLRELAGGPGLPITPPRAAILAVAAVSASLLAVATIVSPRIALPAHLRDWTFHAAWADPAFKQLSGFGVLLAILLGLTLSLRKRIPRLALGRYAFWRSAHAVFGTLALVALFAHTGFRLGNNLNLTLAIVLLVSTITGAATGILPGSSSPSHFARTMSSTLRTTHDAAFWMLVPLITFHALKTYYF